MNVNESITSKIKPTLLKDTHAKATPNQYQVTLSVLVTL
jgi:hypothetical protein